MLLVAAANVRVDAGEPDLLEDLIGSVHFARLPDGRFKGAALLVDRERLIRMLDARSKVRVMETEQVLAEPAVWNAKGADGVPDADAAHVHVVARDAVGEVLQECLFDLIALI